MKDLQTIDLDKLTPGPETDVLVAEFVMGWEWFMYDIDTNQRGRILRPRQHPDEGPTWKECGYEESVVNSWYVNDLPFSADIAAADKVWSQMESNGHEPGIYKRGKVYRCHSQTAGNTWEEATTKPMAICLAALSDAKKKGSDHE